MKCTTFLQRQHRHVEQLLDALAGERYVRGALLRDLADDLSATITIEAACFYPAAREVFGDTLSASEAHDAMTHALQALFEAEADTLAFDRRLDALRAQVRAHFARTERDLFPMVEKAFPPDELERLGAQMRKLQREVVESEGTEHTSSIGRPSRADWYAFDLGASAAAAR